MGVRWYIRLANVYFSQISEHVGANFSPELKANGEYCLQPIFSPKINQLGWKPQNNSEMSVNKFEWETEENQRFSIKLLGQGKCTR